MTMILQGSLYTVGRCNMTRMTCYTVVPLYNTRHYNPDSDITQTLGRPQISDLSKLIISTEGVRT